MKIKIKLFISFIFLFLPLINFAQLTLTVEIEGLRNNQGQVHFELSNTKEQQVAALTQNIVNNKCTIVVKNLKPGKYSFKFFHDENKNDNLDSNWLGIPKEGFGFSNNPSMTFGPPAFEKTIFELNKSVVLKTTPKYY